MLCDSAVIIKWFSSYLIIMILIGHYLFIMMVSDKEFDSWRTKMYGYFLLTTSIVANRACNLVIMLKPYKKEISYSIHIIWLIYCSSLISNLIMGSYLSEFMDLTPRLKQSHVMYVSKRPKERRNSRDLKMRINVVLMSSS